MDSENKFNDVPRNNPMSLINDYFHSRRNQSFLRQLDDFFQQSNKGNIISVDIQQTPNYFILKSILPGVSKDEIELQLVGNQLEIDIQNKKHNYRKRIIDLPSNILKNNMKATHQDGILKIKFPKKQGEKIEIE